MNVADPAGEYLRIAEHYRQLKDEELLELIQHRDKLTSGAQQALEIEIGHRGLKIDAAGEEPSASRKSAIDGKSGETAKAQPSFGLAASRPATPKIRDAAAYNSQGAEISSDPADNDDAERDDEGDEADPYEEERKLITAATVWSLRDALKLQRVLDVAGIPFYMGKELVTGVDEVKSDFAKGVDVQIMQVGWPWAYDAMKRNYFPEDQPPSALPKDPKPLVVRCPRCHSTDVIFSGLAPVVGASAEESPRKFRWTCDACGKEWEDEGLGKEEDAVSH